jgi:hypothetical protein
MPLGGNNAACVVVVCTSFSHASSLTGLLDRLLQRTLQQDGSVGQPPTQLVYTSSIQQMQAQSIIVASNQARTAIIYTPEQSVKVPL